MLNSDALQQLTQLKKTIEESKDYGAGIVRGTQNRFGFVLLDDGREAFLPPEEMQQVLPGDRVKVSLIENEKKKHEAKLEKLISSELKAFVGRYTEKGRNHFVAADHPQLSRWFFVTPKQRKDFKDGDLVSCQLLRHPFGDGKAQTKIVTKIGRADDIGIERRYTIHKHGLATEWSDEAQQQVEAIKAQAAQPDDEEAREDLTQLNFVTIDAESTQDMDDAVYAEAADEGWTLYTAIADPAAYIDAESPLDVAAKQRASSLYFPGASVPMFPNELSQDAFSLISGARRPVLVCRQGIDPAGKIVSYQFSTATIQSRNKLSYHQVADFLENGNASAVPDSCCESLTHLHEIAKARKHYRSQHYVVQDDKFDYVFRLNKRQKIERVELRQPTLAHQVVEEAMLATNCCAGALFAEISKKRGQAGGGLFSSHAGFRDERLQEIGQLLKKDKPTIENLELRELDSYRRLVRELQQDAADAVLLATLKRRLQPAKVSFEAAPHFGLGFDYYATITSPIRRYQDLHNQRVIKAHLNQQTADYNESLPADLQLQIIRNRQASRQVEHWLLCQFMAGKTGQEFEAGVVSVASQGILVRLVDTGAEGFIQIRGGKDQPVKYDSLRMTLSHNEKTFHLEQKLKVKLKKVDLAGKQLQLELCDSMPEVSSS